MYIEYVSLHISLCTLYIKCDRHRIFYFYHLLRYHTVTCIVHVVDIHEMCVRDVHHVLNLLITPPVLNSNTEEATPRQIITWFLACAM